MNETRKLGDEWKDWNGENESNIDTNRSIFLLFSLAVIILTSSILFLIYYLINPRLDEWHSFLPDISLGLIIFVTVILFLWYSILLISNFTNVSMTFLSKSSRFLLGFLLTNVFKLAKLLRFSKDKMGNSFVKVSNAFMMACRKKNDNEKLLILLPRCLEKGVLKKIKEIKNDYKNLEVAVVSGGELARKKVKEFRPTAIIGIACERDLISGIKDVGIYYNVIGIPNCRPDGPCKNTTIDLNLLIKHINYYLA